MGGVIGYLHERTGMFTMRQNINNVLLHELSQMFRIVMVAQMK